MQAIAKMIPIAEAAEKTIVTKAWTVTVFSIGTPS